MDQRGHDMLEDHPIGHPRPMTAQRMGRRKGRMRGQQRGKLLPNGFEQAYWKQQARDPPPIKEITHLHDRRTRACCHLLPVTCLQPRFQPGDSDSLSDSPGLGSDTCGNAPAVNGRSVNSKVDRPSFAWCSRWLFT